MNQRPTLCQYVQGVLFGFRSGAHEIQGLVLAEALQSAFNVDARPQSWLLAFAENEQAIVAAALERYSWQSADFVVVRKSDLCPHAPMQESPPA